VPEWGQTVADLTGGVGVDHVVEVGGPNTLLQSITASRTGGHLAIIGAVAGFDGGIPFAISQAKRLRLQGVTVGSRRDQIEAVRAIEANGIKPVVDSSFPLEGLADAFRHLQAGKHIGKICLDI
jgi:NADPH:quinone reductase-like Zn-dependent oxidoreductase